MLARELLDQRERGGRGGNAFDHVAALLEKDARRNAPHGARRAGTTPAIDQKKITRPSEETQRLVAIADEQVLRLLIVIEHHLVVLAADARLLVAAERRVRRIRVIAVRPHAPGLDLAAEAICARAVTRPHARAEAVERVVGDLQRFLFGLERGHRNDRPEDLFLEDAHLVVAAEHGRLHVIARAEFAGQRVAFAANQALRAFLLAEVDVREDLLQLFLRCLRADHRLRVERMALLDRRHALERALHEAVVDLFVDQHARRAGTHFALIEREHREAFERLVEIAVVVIEHVGEENVRALAAQFQRHGNDVLARVLHDQAARRRFAGEGDLGDALVRRERLACFEAEAVHDVEHARRQQILNDLGEHEHRGGRLLGGFEHDAVAGRERGRELPGGHQDREIPRDDLADHAERFMEVIGDRVVIDFGDAAFLRAHAAREIAKVIGRERNVGGQRFAQRLAVVDGFGHGELVQVLLDAVGDAIEDVGALGRRGLAPGGLGFVRGVERQLDVGFARARNRRERMAGDRRDVVEILAAQRRDPLAADEVAVLLLVRELGRQELHVRVIHLRAPRYVCVDMGGRVRPRPRNRCSSMPEACQSRIERSAGARRRGVQGRCGARTHAARSVRRAEPERLSETGEGAGAATLRRHGTAKRRRTRTRCSKTEQRAGKRARVKKTRGKDGGKRDELRRAGPAYCRLCSRNSKENLQCLKLNRSSAAISPAARLGNKAKWSSRTRARVRCSVARCAAPATIWSNSRTTKATSSTNRSTASRSCEPLSGRAPQKSLKEFPRPARCRK
ncbi:hypothetical protein PT2222_10131 [Paraburkholderia tropica]